MRGLRHFEKQLFHALGTAGITETLDQLTAETAHGKPCQLLLGISFPPDPPRCISCQFFQTVELTARLGKGWRGCIARQESPPRKLFDLLVNLATTRDGGQEPRWFPESHHECPVLTAQSRTQRREREPLDRERGKPVLDVALRQPESSFFRQHDHRRRPARLPRSDIQAIVGRLDKPGDGRCSRVRAVKQDPVEVGQGEHRRHPAAGVESLRKARPESLFLCGMALAQQGVQDGTPHFGDRRLSSFGIFRQQLGDHRVAG